MSDEQPDLEERRAAVSRMVERYKQQRSDPPVWSRREMVLTFIKISFALGFAMLILFPFLTGSIRERRNDRKLQRLVADMARLEDTIRHQIRQTGVPFDPVDFALPEEEFIAVFAGRYGGAPFYQHQAQVLTRDLYSSGREYTDPIRYQLGDEYWYLISRGPSLSRDIPDDFDFTGEDVEERLAPFTYDPTNGVESMGDIWIRGTLQRTTPAASAGVDE